MTRDARQWMRWLSLQARRKMATQPISQPPALNTHT